MGVIPSNRLISVILFAAAGLGCSGIPPRASPAWVKTRGTPIAGRPASFTCKATVTSDWRGKISKRTGKEFCRFLEAALRVKAPGWTLTTDRDGDYRIIAEIGAGWANFGTGDLAVKTTVTLDGNELATLTRKVPSRVGFFPALAPDNDELVAESHGWYAGFEAAAEILDAMFGAHAEWAARREQEAKDEEARLEGEKAERERNEAAEKAAAREARLAAAAAADRQQRCRFPGGEWSHVQGGCSDIGLPEGECQARKTDGQFVFRGKCREGRIASGYLSNRSGENVFVGDVQSGIGMCPWEGSLERCEFRNFERVDAFHRERLARIAAEERARAREEAERLAAEEDERQAQVWSRREACWQQKGDRESGGGQRCDCDDDGRLSCRAAGPSFADVAGALIKGINSASQDIQAAQRARAEQLAQARQAAAAESARQERAREERERRARQGAQERAAQQARDREAAERERQQQRARLEAMRAQNAQEVARRTQEAVTILAGNVPETDGSPASSRREKESAPGRTTLEAIAYCRQNDAGNWSCDGPLQVTTSHEGDEGLKKAREYAGCASPRRQERGVREIKYWCGFGLKPGLSNDVPRRRGETLPRLRYDCTQSPGCRTPISSVEVTE